MKTKFIEGKKVEIIQELNSTQTVVKEIFVDDKGNEVPHGECFTVTTSKLSDSPLASWKEAQLKKYEAEWEEMNKKWRKKIEDAERNLKIQYDKVYHLTKSVQGMAASLGSDASMTFIRLLDFMSGRIKWVVIKDWDEPIVLPIDEFIDKYMYMYDRGVEGVKLLTLFGSPNRDGVPKGLNFRLNNYNDGYGSSKEIFIFNEEHEAIEKAREILEQATYIGFKHIELAEKYGATLDPEKVKKFWTERKESVQKDLNATVDKLAGYKNALAEIESHL